MSAKIRLFCVGVCCIFVALCVTEAQAIVNLTDSISIGGYIDNNTGVRLFDGADGQSSGDLSRSRFTLQLEGKWKLTDYLHFSSIMRGFYEAGYKYNAGVNEDPYHLDAAPDGDPMDNDVDLREYYADYYVGDLSVRIGKQQIVWGESDALRMSDIINPLDLSWWYMFADWEDIRVPLRMIRATYNIPSKNNLFVEGVFNLEDFRPNTVAPAGANWAIPGLPQMLQDEMSLQTRDDDPKGVHGCQGGVRFGGVFGGWDVKGFAYRGLTQDAAYEFDLARAMAGYPIPLDFKYQYINTYGATFNYFDNITSTVFRGECAFTQDQPFIASPMPTPIGPVPSAIKEFDTFAFMIGFDRPTFIKFLNPTKTFFISGQFFQKWALGLDSDVISTGMGRTGDDNKMSVGTFLINTEYWDSKIKPEMLVAHDVTGSNGFFKAKLMYEPNYLIGFTLGYLAMWGTNDNSGIFGPARANDEIYGSVRIKF